MTSDRLLTLAALLALLLPAAAVEPFRPADDRAQTVDLLGEWLFAKDGGSKEGVGLDQAWQAPDFDDSGWGSIRVGESWEAQGHNYNGIAWYRQRVYLPESWRGQPLHVRLGRPDDRGTVWINGVEVQTVEQYGPHFAFVLDGEPLRFGQDNVIAVRIADWYKNGGLNGGTFAIERLAPFSLGGAAESAPPLALGLADKLPDDPMADERYTWGWRDGGTSDTRPRMSVARGDHDGADALAMEVWYPNSSGEFIDYQLPAALAGDVWKARGADYLAFWLRSDDTAGEFMVRLANKPNRWKTSGVNSYEVRVVVEPGAWQRVILPFAAFTKGSVDQQVSLTDTGGLDVIALGYRNHELQRPGTIRLAGFEVGAFRVGPLAGPISLDGPWRFERDDHRPDGTPRDLEVEADKAGYGEQLGWHRVEHDDGDWGVIRVGDSWEDQGHGYDGPAWYRCQVEVPAAWSGRQLRLRLGKPDDRGEIYWNGELVQTVATYGPDFDVMLDPDQVRFGATNTIAVRVVDWYRNGGLTQSPFTLGPARETVLLREVGKPETEAPLSGWEMGSRPGKALEVVLRFYGGIHDGDDLVVDYRLKECFHREIAAGTAPLSRRADGELEAVIALDDAEARRLYYGEWITTRGLVRSGSDPVMAFSRNRERLAYDERDGLALPALPETYEDTPYGRLKLVDVIDCAIDPAADVHPYKEGGIRDSWVGRRAYATWEQGVTVKRFEGRGYREANNNEHFLYRIGRGEIEAQQPYLLRVLYPDHVKRYQAMHIKAGRNYQGTGFKSAYQRSGEWQWYDHIVVPDHTTYGYKGERGAAASDGRHGFWVAFHDIGRCYAPGYEAGPAAAEIRLYAIEDLAAALPMIRRPEGLPQRTLMADWERMPDRVPEAMVQEAQFLGLSAVGPVFMKWGAAAYFQLDRSHYSVPESDAWNSVVVKEPDPALKDNHLVYDRYLAATKAASLTIIPRMEYGGSPELPAEARVIGTDGKVDPCGRFCHWGANILHPATWAEVEALLHDMIGTKIADNPQIGGLLYRMRQDRIKCSYGKRDVQLFCDETGADMPTGDAAAIARWAAVTNKDAYQAWWQTKHRDFLVRIRDQLRSYRDDLELYYYNWDPDGWRLGGYHNSPEDWSDYYNVDRAHLWHQRVVAASEKRKPEDYLEILLSHPDPHWRIDTSLFAEVDGIHVFAPVHDQYLADNAPYLEYFRTGSGVAMCNMFNYEEKGRWNIQGDNYQTSEMTPEAGYSMADEVQTCFHVDPGVITWTTYTFGRGFADEHRRFAQAYLALPDLPARVIADALPADHAVASEIRVRSYDGGGATYIGVVHKGLDPIEVELALPVVEGRTTVTDLVTGEQIEARVEDGRLRLPLALDRMSLSSYRIDP